MNELRESLDKNKFNWFYLPCDEILKKSFNPFIYFLNNFFEQSEENSEEKNKSNFEVKFNTLTKITKDDEIKKEFTRGKSFLGALLNLFWEGSLYQELDAKGRYENTLYALKAFVKAQCLQKPVILELDDGHWIDSDSINQLNVLTHNVEEYPFIIISACRYNDDESQFYFDLSDVIENRIELNYLGKNSSRNLILAKLKEAYKDEMEISSVPNAFFDFIWEKSTGNPFYIEQLILYLHDRSLLDVKLNLKRKQIEIPSNINAIIIARIDRLAEDVKEVIKTASVIGKEFLVKILSEMLKSLSIEFKSDKLKNVIETGET